MSHLPILDMQAVGVTKEQRDSAGQWQARATALLASVIRKGFVGEAECVMDCTVATFEWVAQVEESTKAMWKTWEVL